MVAIQAIPNLHERGPAMTSIESLTLEAPDITAADAFYTAAFGLDGEVALCASDAPTTGFRGFTVSLVVSQPATVDGLIGLCRRRPQANSLRRVTRSSIRFWSVR